jgi:hypothetical protein
MTSEAIESLLDRTKKAYDCDGKDVIYEEQDIRRCLVGLDQSQESIKDLVESHKVKARVTDICSPWNDFSAASKIKPGSQDIVMTSHTLDRTQDPDRQLRNMVRSCAIGGQIVIVSKTGLSPVSDGREKRRDKRLVFSETDLRSDNKITLLTKLQERLGKYGVEMRAVGKHPSRIISADCNTESGPQKFSSLVIVGEKVGEVDFDK